VPDDVAIEYLVEDEWKTYRADVPSNLNLIREALLECARVTGRHVRATQGGKIMPMA
jgi:hypothetical protein